MIGPQSSNPHFDPNPHPVKLTLASASGWQFKPNKYLLVFLCLVTSSKMSEWAALQQRNYAHIQLTGENKWPLTNQLRFLFNLKCGTFFTKTNTCTIKATEEFTPCWLSQSLEETSTCIWQCSVCLITLSEEGDTICAAGLTQWEGTNVCYKTLTC